MWLNARYMIRRMGGMTRDRGRFIGGISNLVGGGGRRRRLLSTSLTSILK